ncbi:tumor necrosis factor receptor superfamily member 9a [Poecilia reticulata]|uniref:tumor necrosis factor receptor superfamily member 9a n=1 Tax=Poecilia reticulata TaxID=8081 RepID=UPI0004A229BD|nr:PREDICTED: tumor necrosis factor receptor superfamily member 9-like [Poecilia reticulata]XP_008412522.1 PREDICTED: tumor necrosis factor receptor superfamily member 9-like [Poecilia reticulata]
MAGFFWMLGLALLAQGFLCILGDVEVGCKKWVPDTEDKGSVKCIECHPGNRLVKPSGTNPQQLCTPCEDGTYTYQSLGYRCSSCIQCVGALVHFKDCTPKSNTQCRCKEGLRCGDAGCTFCVDECGKGEEPTKKRDCRPCPKGTFNDQIHQDCKSFSTRCPDPTHIIVFQGNASSDIICELPQPPTTLPVTNPKTKPEKPDGNKEQLWPMESFAVIGALMMCLIIFIVLVSALIHCKGKKEKAQRRTPSKTPIVISSPSDEPRTLIAIECSFHEAQQEQGNSTESLISKDSEEEIV